MKSMHEITMDFNNANTQADNLDAVAKDIDNMIKNEFDPCMTDIGKNWTGDNAEAYIAKGYKLKSQIEKSAANLRKTANTIRNIARNTYNAEKAAYELAQARTYNK